MTFTIDDITMPTAPGARGWDVFAEYAGVRNAVETSTLGTDLLTMAMPETLSEYQDTRQRIRRHFAGRLDGRLVARGMVTSRPMTPETGVHLMVDVLPDVRGRGLGAAMFDRVDAVAAELAAPVLKATLPHAPLAGGERIASPSGFGDLAARDPGVRFLQARGFSLEQVDRISLLELDGLPDRVAPLRAAAVAASADEYRVVSWVGPTPDEHLEGIAELRTRMSTDAPYGALVMVTDTFDVARVREHDARLAASGRSVVVAAVVHVPSGTLAGFSEIVFADRGVAMQEDTLVLREHRGHRLGMRVKLAAAELLAEHAPHVRAVVTWNAEENRPMLDVNEALGFRAIGSEASWQRLESGRE